jgi:pimeloyl-ACP methyl ester carboxylesterase
MEFEYKGQNLYFEKQGVGNVLLFVHGWGGSVESLKKLSLLSKYDSQSYIIDLPGFARSNAPSEIWGVDEYAEILIAFIESINNGNPINYFGHSFGGGLGVYIAAKRPDLIENLVLCGAAVVREPKVARSVRLAQKYVPGYERIKEYVHPIKRLIYKTAFPESDSLKHPHVEASFRKIIQDDLQKYLADVKCPTLILWGDEDRDTPLEYGRIIEKGIEGSVIKVFNGYSHNLPLVNPAEVYSEINNFLTAR